MGLRIYDTMSREKRPFVPVTPGRVAMYVCGMTVQDRPHVGHIRAALSGEVMRRYLMHLGFEVVYVYNFTDVDDRIIEKANRSLQPATTARGESAGRRASKTHRMLVDLIKAGEAEKAAALWSRHLQKAEEYVLSGAEMSTVVDLLE